MPERRRRQRGMPAYQPVRQKRALQMLTLQQGRHRSQPGRRQKVQPLQSSQRKRPRPRPLRPLKKPVSHHKVQQKLNCQERRQKVQPVMQPGMQRPQQKKARESAESAQSAEQSRIAAEEAVNRIPHRGGASRAKGGNRVPRVLRGRREIKESVATPARQGQPVKGGPSRRYWSGRPAGAERRQGRAGRDRSDGRCRSTGSKGRYRCGRPGRPTGTERRNRCGWPGGGQPDLRDRRATRGRHKSVFVWGRRALLRQTAMAGSRIQMAHSSPD